MQAKKTNMQFVELENSQPYSTGIKFSLELKFCYFANGKFAKFLFRYLSHFLESFNNSLYY